jgi:glycosyltransferase involved in cell wall biosynthesis
VPENSFPQQAEYGSTPKITVAMPVFNGGQHLRLAVLSIVGQTFQDWELLLIDDGSTDNALQGIADIHDCRIRVLRDGINKGLAARLNEAIDLARGQYFARMDHDDVSYPERFAHQVALLESNPELDVVAARSITISDDDEQVGNLPCPLTHREICARPWLGFYFPHPTWMGHTTWFRTYRYAFPSPYFCEDQELLLRSHAKSRFATVDRVLFAYRVRSRFNWKKQIKTRWTLFNIQVRYFLSSGQPLFALLALAAFAGRIASDLLTMLRQALSGQSFSRAKIDSTESPTWKNVLRATRGES